MPTPNDEPSDRPTVLFLSANPTSLDLLDIEGEIQSIQTELDRSYLGKAFRFVFHPATTAKNLQRVMLGDRPTVVQFSGHGRGANDSCGDPTGILLHHEDDHHEVQVVSGEALGDLFSKAGHSVRLVFLNACYSAQQAQAIATHVDFVIGMDGLLSDRGAKIFAVALYRALAYGRTLQNSFDLAVNALMLGRPEYDVKLPELFRRDGVRATRARLVEPPKDAGDPTWDVFISYAGSDRQLVYPVADELEKRGIRIFYDEWEIKPGDLLFVRLDQGLRESTHGLLAVSTNTLESPRVQNEYAALLQKAVMEQRYLVPVLIGAGEVKLPPFLKIRAPVDLRNKAEAEYCREIGRLVGVLRKPL